MSKFADLRLSAAELSREEFLGEIHIDGDAVGFPDEMIKGVRNEFSWQDLHEHSLLIRLDGYSLRYDLSFPHHKVFLVYESEIVGFFMERDTLIIESNHQGNGLGRELVLAAFAQKPWKNLVRHVSPAGRKAFERAYELAQLIQQGGSGDGGKPSN